MDIPTLRTLFKSDSGLISLTDIEVDQYLNKGIKFLDKITYSKVLNSRYFILLKAGTNAIVLPSELRSIRELWVQNLTVPTDSYYRRLRLGKISFTDLRNPYFDTTTVNGRPQYYCPIIGGILSNLTANKLSFYCDLGDVTLDEGLSRVIGIWPTADIDYPIEVHGNFFSPPITSVTATSNGSYSIEPTVPAETGNWWTINHPELVILAALYTQDRTYRNTSGGLELLNHILADVKSINDDDVEEDSMTSECSVMEG